MFSKENTVKKMKKGRIGAGVYFYVVCAILFSISSNAQCAMCRAALTGNENKTQAVAVNDGIVYLMVIPYVLVAAVGYYVYRLKKKKE